MPPRKSKKVKKRVKGHRKLKRIQHGAPPVYPGRLVGSARPPDMGWTQAVQRPPQMIARAEIQTQTEPPPPLPTDFSASKFNFPTRMLPLEYSAGVGSPKKKKKGLRSQSKIDQMRFDKLDELTAPPLPVMDFSLAKFQVPTKMLPLEYTPGVMGEPELQTYGSKLKSQDRINQMRFGKMRESQHEPSPAAWSSPDAAPPPEPDMTVPEGKPQSLFHNRDVHMPDIPINEDHDMEDAEGKFPDIPNNEDVEMVSAPIEFRVDHRGPLSFNYKSNTGFNVEHQGPFAFNPPKSKWHRAEPSESTGPTGSFTYKASALPEAAKSGSVAWPEAPAIQMPPTSRAAAPRGDLFPKAWFSKQTPSWNREPAKKLPSEYGGGWRFKAPQEQTQVAAIHFGQPEKRKAEEITLSKLDRQRDHATVQIAKKSTQKTKKSRTV
jgi:hypothetical protein